MNLGYLESQKRLIDYVTTKKKIWQAIILGIAGYYSIPVLRFCTHLFTNTVQNNETHKMIFEYPLWATLLFFASSILVYFTCISLKGKKCFYNYLIANGFNGSYFLLTIILFTPIIFLSKLISQDGQVHSIIIGAAIAFVIIGIFAIIFTVKYGIHAISEVFRFGFSQSAMIWFVLYVPLFAVYIKLLKY